MKVLQVHNVQTAYGGVDEVIRLEGCMLADAGHKVELFSVSTPELVKKYGKIQLAWRSISNRDACRSLARKIEAFRPDIVHYHTPLPLGSLALLKVARACGVASIGTSHSFRYSCLSGTLTLAGVPCVTCVGRRLKIEGVRNRCYHGSLGGSLALASGHAIHQTIGDYRTAVDKYLVMTHFARELLEAEGVPPERIVVKPNFSEDLVSSQGESVRGQRTKRLVVYLGRLEPEKGVKTLMDAWAKVVDLPVELVIAGTGSMERWVKDRVSSLPNAEFIGFQSRSQVRDLLNCANVMVFPSEWYEAGPTLSMMEAFSAGCPVIGSDIGNFTEAIVDRKNGWHFKSGDSESLARRILEMANCDPQTLTSMSLTARRTYEETYSAEVVLPQLVAAYASARSMK